MNDLVQSSWFRENQCRVFTLFGFLRATWLGNGVSAPITGTAPTA
ncbi:hypothetical protein N9D23_10805 [Rubripirellula sp.]|nr:hypothetical protein [Rubripirellula sp.]